MDYIISPLAIYLIKTVDGVIAIAITMEIVALIIGAVCFFAFVDSGSPGLKRAFRIAFVVAGLLLPVALFVPSSETIIQMLVAKHITYDALASASDVVVQVYNDILNLFNS